MDHLNGVMYVDRMDTRTFRRVDMLDQPLPKDHPEFGKATKLGVQAAGGVKKIEAAPMGPVSDVVGFIGKGREGKKRRSR